MGCWGAHGHEWRRARVLGSVGPPAPSYLIRPKTHMKTRACCARPPCQGPGTLRHLGRPRGLGSWRPAAAAATQARSTAGAPRGPPARGCPLASTGSGPVLLILILIRQVPCQGTSDHTFDPGSVRAGAVIPKGVCNYKNTFLPKIQVGYEFIV